MSEYQFVHFLAVDKPLDDKQLAYMQRQSSRAEISQWEFTNDYHYGDFRGNAAEMLRRGYDLHLHYANFGIRKLMIRLPAGLPCSKSTFKAFAVEDSVVWHADKSGKAGILEIEPESDAGTFDEELYDVASLLPKIAPVRDLLMAGDLRPLYLAWLACPYDEEALEPPVPAGLDRLPKALDAMATFFEVDEDLLAAAAETAPPAPESTDAGQALEGWLAKRSPDELRELTRRLLDKDAAACRAETLASVRDATDTQTWPLAKATRTLAELREAAEGLRERRLARKRQGREAARRKRLKAIAADPAKVVESVEALVGQRSGASYSKAAQELADLREALGPDAGPARARAIAAELRRKHPTLTRLVGALRKLDLLD